MQDLANFCKSFGYIHITWIENEKKECEL
jgi:hypothetical protein